MKNQALLTLSLFLALIASSCQPKTSNKETTTTEEHTQVTDGHNAQNSLDWEGIYEGLLPCADCEGIATTITLNKDMTYHIQSKYLGKEEHAFEEKGTFTWNKAGNTIALSGTDGSGLYFVGENQLFHLDQEGNRVTGPLAENYILKKVTEPANSPHTLTSTYWKLTELEEKPIARKSNHNDKEIHMAFNAEDNRINGFAGCNSFGGIYEIVGEESFENKITFSQVFSTQMACPDLSIESELFKALEATASYQISKKTLSLYDTKKNTLATFEANSK